MEIKKLALLVLKFPRHGWGYAMLMGARGSFILCDGCLIDSFEVQYVSSVELRDGRPAFNGSLANSAPTPDFG